VGVVGQNKNLATTSIIFIINFSFDETWQGKNKSSARLTPGASCVPFAKQKINTKNM
jgi:hypothetical protein